MIALRYLQYCSVQMKHEGQRKQKKTSLHELIELKTLRSILLEVLSDLHTRPGGTTGTSGQCPGAF